MDNTKNIIMIGIIGWIFFDLFKHDKPRNYKRKHKYYKEIPYKYMYGTMPRRYKKMKKFSKRLNK